MSVASSVLSFQVRQNATLSSPLCKPFAERFTILCEFSKNGIDHGLLIYEKVQQTQAYILNEQNSYILGMFNSPFEQLDFKSNGELDTFRMYLSINYTVKTEKVDGGIVDVLLSMNT